MRVWEAVEYILADHYVSDAEAAEVLDPSFATRYDNDGVDHREDVQRDAVALGQLKRALTDPNIALEAGAARRIVADLGRRGYWGLTVPAARAAAVPQPSVPNAVNGSPLTGPDPTFDRLREVAKHPRPGDHIVAIGINDLPVDFSHPALSQHQRDARTAYDWVNHTRGATSDPNQWHGTANAVLGAQGTGWLSVMANKVMPAPDYEAVLASIEPTIRNGARVINLAELMGLQDNAERFAAIVRAHPRVLFVVAAGNDGATFTQNNAATLGALQDLPNLMVVGGATADGHIMKESNRGSPWVTIAARGEGVWVPFSMQQAAHGNVWTQANGTSFACPQVSNCGGKMMLLCPDLDAGQVSLIMQTTVDRVADWQGMNQAGGVLNPTRAMSVAAAMSLVREQGYSARDALAATGLGADDVSRYAALVSAML